MGIDWKKQFDEIFLVSLDRRPDRRENALNQLSNVGIVPRVFAAIDGSKLGLKDANNQFTPGMIGCFLSHYIIFHTAFYNNYTKILVFEDDCKLMNGFNGFMAKAFENMPVDCDFAYLGWYHYPHNNNKHTEVNKWWVKPSVVWGTQCYMVNSRKAIETIWQGIQEMKNQIDVQLNRMVLPNSGLNYYAIMPSCVSQYRTDSDVQNLRAGKL